MLNNYIKGLFGYQCSKLIIIINMNKVHRLEDCVLVSGASYGHARKIDKSVFNRLTYSRFTDCNDRAMN